MNKTKLLLSFLFFLFFAFFRADAQTCSITPSSYKVCLGSSVIFNLTTNGTVSKTSWTFGDGASDTLTTAAHIYSSSGSYTVTVIVRFTNNTTCTATVTQPIKVFDLPKANFTKSRDTLCLSGSLCLNNTSTLGSSGAPIRKVTFLFGDGAIVYNQSSPCHTYSKTGNFIVSLEVEDTNGCISRIEKPVRVVDDVKVQLQAGIINCGLVNVSNVNAYPRNLVKRYYWDFGDGIFDSSASSYFGVIHNYNNTLKCPFIIRLYIESIYGCSDSKTITVCPLYNFNIKLTKDNKRLCARNNSFNFSNPFNPGAQMMWRYKPLGTASWSNLVYGTAAQYSFKDCGVYVISLEIKSGFCDTLVYDTIEVLGPQARIESDTIAPFEVINHHMCTPDTAYFVSPTLYQSRHCSSSIKLIWDFGDTKCPPCTTDTRNGQNVGSNCRWSKDSVNVKHRYTDTGCYLVRLTLWDTITGCRDSDYIIVNIGRPDLSKLKVTGRQCLGAPQSVDFKDVKPICEAEEFWFNKDTLCFGNSSGWIKMKPQNFIYIINATCKLDRAVTGFAMKNGNCYDTIYITRNFPKLNPGFGLTKTAGCAPFTTTTFINDSFQYSCTRAVWDWGDNSALTIDSTIANGFVKSQTHTFLNNGLYQIKLTLYDTVIGGGCSFEFTYDVGVGFKLDFGYSSFLCNSRSFQFNDFIKFYSNPYTVSNPYVNWKGTVKWYFGDGATDTTRSPTHYYAKAGRYMVKLVATDTSGCIDSNSHLVKINELHVDFTWSPQVLVCGQIVQFKDSSWVKDSSDVLPKDSIISWTWDFGDQRITSNLKNPAHAYFVNGEFFVKLKVKTWKGCEDSVVIKINIAGPQPHFDLLTDSVGCAPYTIKLVNTSVDCDQNIIYMGDAGNTNFVLKKFDTLNFTYQLPGLYYIYIFGESNFKNPNTGSNVYCSAWYPDKSNPKAKLIRIRVLAKPPVRFEIPDTICVNTSFDIINKSDKVYDFYSWDYGDSTTELKLRPDTNSSHSYTKTGRYTITLKPNYTPLLNQKECPDTFTKSIVVVDLAASFTMDTSEAPLIKFWNTSNGAQSYLWDFGHPASGSKNSSKDYNASHDFLNDTGEFTICLTATNNYGCKDSVCSIYHNSNYRSLIIPNVFTVDNDGINDAFDIEIHGEIYYEISIYNRWGALIYQNTNDGLGNDGNNWNGSLNNTGAALPDGEYYFNLKYQFRGEEIKSYKGIVTMIR